MASLLDKIGTISGAIASITYIFPWGTENETFRTIVFIGGILTLTVTAVFHFKLQKKIGIGSDENEFFPFKNKEKQDFYDTHLKSDIAILDKTRTDQKSNFYYAFAFTPHEKKLPIKAHFFTAENRDPIKYRGLFSAYKEAVEINEDLYRKGVTLALIVSELKIELNRLGYDYDRKDKQLWKQVWVIPEALETAMKFYGDIKRFNETWDFDLLLKFVRSIPMFYNLTMGNDGKQEIVKLNDNAIVGAPTWEIGNKFYEVIQSELNKFKQTANDIIEINDIWFYAKKYHVDEIIKNNIEDIKKGTPIMGVCKRCLECFTSIEKKKWNKSSDNFYAQKLDERY